MLLALVIAVLSSLFFYVEAFSSGMPAKKWALAGLVMGPFVLPMFAISQHVTLRQARGYNNLYLRA